MTSLTTGRRDAVAHRAVGSAELAVVSAGRIRDDAPLFPADRDWRSSATLDEHGRVVFGLLGLVIRIGDAVVVVDPPFFLDDAEASAYFAGERGLGAADALLAMGLTPTDVTHVVITHGHRDHYWGVLASHDEGGRLAFPVALHHVPALDSTPRPGALLGDASGGHFDGLREEDFVARLRAYLAPARRAGLLSLVSGDVDICPGVRLVHTGGETDGHCIVRIESDGELAFYLGDLVHFPAEVAEPDIGPARLGADQLAALEAARRRLFADAADHRAAVVFTHAPFPGWGRIETTGDGWRWLPDAP